MARIAPLLCVLALLALACRAPRGRPGEERIHGPSPEIRGPVSIEGRPLVHHVFGEGPRTVLYLAAIHGDEPAGTPLLRTLIEVLDADVSLTRGWRAVIAPIVNPDGFEAGTRRNASGVDLNRNFPAVNFLQSVYHGHTPLSEPESVWVQGLIVQYQPEVILSIHQPLDRIDYDGPAHELAYRMAAKGPLDVKRLGSRPGSLGAWAGEDRGRMVITLELPRDATELTPEEAWETYGDVLLEAMR